MSGWQVLIKIIYGCRLPCYCKSAPYLRCWAWHVHSAACYLCISALLYSDLLSFEIRFEFESNFRFGIRFVLMIRFEIFESSAPSIVLCKETIGSG